MQRLAIEQHKRWQAIKTNKLQYIKRSLENGEIVSFQQMTLILGAGSFAKEVGISLYQFEIKVKNPLKFTLGEIHRLIVFLDISYEAAWKFIDRCISDNKKV